MRELITNLLHLNTFLLNKLRGTQAYDEAMALYQAKEYRKALPVMTEAAQKGSLEAMSILGSMYLLGQGVKENGPMAERWLRAAVDGGYENAASVLGMAYATGKAGVKIDITQATALLTAAAQRGDEQSQRMLDMMTKGEGMFRNLKKKR